jgi:hypothetical protein
VNLYELLRRLVTGQTFYPEDREAALDLIEKLEKLNAFGSVALYTGDHVCEGELVTVWDDPQPSAFRGRQYTPPKARQIMRCKECKREMDF